MTMVTETIVSFHQAGREVNLDLRGQLLPHVLQDERGLPRWQKDHEHHL